MKTNALLATCAALLGALLMLMSAMAFGLASPVSAQDNGDDSKNTSSDDYRALAVQAGSNTEVLVVLRKVPSEHPFHKEEFPTALSLGAYAIEMNGQSSGKINFIGSRYIDKDMLFPETTKMSKSPKLSEIDELLVKYRAAAAKAASKKR